MVKCQMCGQEKPESNFEKKVAEILGPNLRLYDFGSAVTQMPIPSPDGNGWLASSVCWIYENNSDEEKGLYGFRVLPVRIDPDVRDRSANILENALLAAIQRAVPLFEKHSFILKEGDSFPHQNLV